MDSTSVTNVIRNVAPMVEEEVKRYTTEVQTISLIVPYVNDENDENKVVFLAEKMIKLVTPRSLLK